MDEKNHNNSQETQLTPEEQLDLLLEKFKEYPIDGEPTPETEAVDNTEAPADICADEVVTPPMPEEAAEIPPLENTDPSGADADAATSLADLLQETEPADYPEEPQPEMPVLEDLADEKTTEYTEFEEETAVLPEMLPMVDIEASDSQETDAESPPAEAENSVTDATPEQDAETVQNQETPESSVAEVIPAEATENDENPPAETESSDPREAPAEERNETDDEAEEEDEEDNAPPKKRRPKNTKAYGFFGIPHVLATFIWLGIIVFIGVGLGKFVWNCASDILALGRPDSVVTITITDEDDLDSIAEKLKTTGLIKYPSLFKIYGQISDAMDSIRTGTFQLNTLFDYHALVDAMSSNQRRVTINVTIPEGYTATQTFRLLESYGVSTVAALEEAAANGELGEYWFLEGVDRSVDNCLEGYLFPDTYTFYLDHNPVGVLQKFLDNFNKRFNDVMKLKLDTLNVTLSDMMRANGLSEEYIAQHQMTLRDVVIIASMIEKETASNPESYTISSVIYNRLTNPNEYPYLNIDATLVYYKGGGNLTSEDLVTDHPYNTYTRPGLVPGPISNPGSYSLDAALDPEQTAYYFYALDPSTGKHHFSKTLKEHEDFLESIRNAQQEEESEE